MKDKAISNIYILSSIKKDLNDINECLNEFTTKSYATYNHDKKCYGESSVNEIKKNNNAIIYNIKNKIIPSLQKVKD